MRTKWFFLLLLLPFACTAQDSLQAGNQAKVGSIVDRFKDITGPDPNYLDSMAVLRRRLSSEVDRNRLLADSLARLREELLLSEKRLLTGKYGASQLAVYDEQQYRDFKENLFLKSYFANQQDVQVFFAFREVEARYSLYTELKEIAERCKADPKSRLAITASSDSYGSELSNAELARQRAENVKEFLVFTLGIDASRIDILPAEASKRISEPELDFLNRRALVRLESGN